MNTPLSISPTIAPSSSTGSDLHETDQDFGFGDISFGSDEPNLLEKFARDALMALAVALAVKFVMGKK